MTDPTTSVFILLNRLERAKISYQLAHFRENAVMVQVAAPGERWEIEFLADGTIEVEKFVSDGAIRDEASIDELFANLSADASD